MTRTLERTHDLQSLGGLTDAVLTLDARWRVTDLNLLAEDLLGNSAAHLAGVSIWSAAPDLAASRLETECRLAFEGGRPRTFDDRLFGPDRWFRVRVLPGSAGVRILMRDVTEEHASAKTRRFLTRAFHHLEHCETPDEVCRVLAGLCVEGLGADLVLVDLCVDSHVQRAAVAAGPDEPEEITDIARRSPPVLEDMEDPIALALRRGVAWEANGRTPRELRARVPIGPSRRVARALQAQSACVLPLVNRGRPLGALTVIWRQKGALDELRQEAVKELASRGATALTHASLVQRVSADSRARDQLLKLALDALSTSQRLVESGTTTASAAAARIQEQMDELVAQVRAHERCPSPRVRSVVPGDAVDRVVQRFALRPDASAPTIQIACDDDVPPVAADPSYLDAVLAALLENAVAHARPGGHIRISVERLEGQVRFNVRDDGEGIAEECLEHVFDRFWREHPERAWGAGLGLTIAAAMVHEHGGQIWAESRPGDGSTFFFTLPTWRELSPSTDGAIAVLHLS